VADLPESADPAVPPPTEAIHVPEPSYLPAAIAFAAMVALVGVITTFVLTVLGAVVVLVCVFRWIGQTRRDLSELPLEH